MGNIVFFIRFTFLTLHKFCRQPLLLAGLVILCLLLPLLAGPAAEYVLSNGVSFSGVTIAVTSDADDTLPQMIEEYTGKMTDVRQYCTFRAMEQQTALRELEDGTVSAVLVLPPSFVEGIQWGENPDVKLIVAGDRPLESLLTLWVGQSASDLLAAVQAGIYAVLDCYDQQNTSDLSRDRVTMEINLRYINKTLDRQDQFKLRRVSATHRLPVSLHYTVGLIAYLTMSVTSLFSGAYTGNWLSAQRRWRCLGRGITPGYVSALTASTLILFLFTAPTLIVHIREKILPLLCAALLWSVFCAVFCGLCCLLTTNRASCGVVTFFIALSSLFVSGGILPPALLPEALNSISAISPVSWLHSLVAMALGYEAEPYCLLILAAATIGMALLSVFLYGRRLLKRTVAQ